MCINSVQKSYIRITIGSQIFLFLFVKEFEPVVQQPVFRTDTQPAQFRLRVEYVINRKTSEAYRQEEMNARKRVRDAWKNVNKLAKIRASADMVVLLDNLSLRVPRS